MRVTAMAQLVAFSNSFEYRLGKLEKNHEYTDHCIVKIDFSTQKSPRNQKRLAITPTPVKKKKLTV